MDNNVNAFATGSEIARDLLDAKAIKLSLDKPFQWSSGWHSPIYCDNRVTLSYPDIRRKIKDRLCDLVKKHFSSADAIAGVATAGIPQGALIADQLNLPFLYVRSKPKGHGMENLIEGRMEKGARIVVVEDLISTGGSSLKAIEALRNNGAEVLGLVAIFSYGFDLAAQNFKDSNVAIQYLSDYNYLLEEALKLNYIAEEQLESLESWRKDPAGWAGF
ncbi:MAG: orotate phosphoribosyltransferase [Cyclobacteriaceae bacterium]|nr:orotate phosphoribosyltransferase [Cyclobacteriaceae bacterium]